LEHTEYRQEETIDLRELLHTIKKRKKLIYFITGTITALALLYAFVLAKPVYEVKAMIEVGKIGAGTKDESPLDDIADIKQKLEYLHGVHSKKKKIYPKLKLITVPKKSQSIFSILVEGRDNSSATTYINKIVEQVEKNYADKVKSYISTQKELISLTEDDIVVSEKNLQEIQDSLKNYHKKILNLSEKDAALAGIYTIQISQNQSRLQGLQSRISALKTKLFNLKLDISPLRINQTHIVGKVEVLDKPVKPKKALTVIVAFITGLMLSLFLIFFLEFLGNIKEKETTEKA
jgi:capsular polysaccharide biosynthesis protein